MWASLSYLMHPYFQIYIPPIDLNIFLPSHNIILILVEAKTLSKMEGQTLLIDDIADVENLTDVIIAVEI